MKRTFKTAIAALMFVVGFAGSVVAGPFEDAAAAYQKGDFATALEPIPRHGWTSRRVLR
jgi:hypothetical protein